MCTVWRVDCDACVSRPHYVSALLHTCHSFASANFEDPNYNIDLPVFTVHGNHDDPSRDVPRLVRSCAVWCGVRGSLLSLLLRGSVCRACRQWTCCPSQTWSITLASASRWVG
jgi:hypothetical protein